MAEPAVRPAAEEEALLVPAGVEREERPAKPRSSLVEPGAVRPATTAFPPSLYALMSLGFLTMALYTLAAPEMAVRSLHTKDAVTPMDAQLPRLMRLNGAALLAVAAASAALATRGWERMGPRSADLLKLGLLGQSLLKFLIFPYYPLTTPPLLGLPLKMGTTALAAALPAFDLMRSGNSRGLMRELSRCLAPARPGSLLAGAHWVLALLFPLSGVALLAAPRFTLFHMLGYSYGSAAFLLARLAGVVDTILIPLTHLLLKGAAERGALALPAARLLSVGMLLAGLGHLAVEMPLMASGECRWLLPVTAATWAASALTCAATLLASADRWAHPSPAASKAEAQAANAELVAPVQPVAGGLKEE